MGVNRKKVLIIFDAEKFTKQMITDDMESEGFIHFFKFISEVTCPEEMISYVVDSDEVWVFGDVVSDIAMGMAVEHGKEIWVMA